MLKKQKEYLDYLNLIESKINGFVENNKIQPLKEKIEQQELIIPIIGAFSAGKSSLINMFLETDILKVDITPETALATELRYSTMDYIEAVNKNETIKFNLSDIDKLKENAKDYQFMRLYLNNKNLKNIEPFVLVDMPGFDSPWELHNQAILNYLSKGVYFVILISVEDGNITKSLLRQINDVYEYEKDFSIFLSKSNLKPDSDVQKIREKIKEQIEDELDLSKDVIPIGKSSKELQKVLDDIDPELIIEQLFLDDINLIYSEIIESLNNKKLALKTSKDENDKKIRDLQYAIESILDKKEDMILEARSKNSNRLINEILNQVESDLMASAPRLAKTALRDENAFQREITEIIRSTLIVELKDKLNDVSMSVLDSFSVGVGIDIQTDDNSSIDLSSITKHLFSMPSVTKSITSMLGGIIKFLPKALNPLVGIVVSLLPHIVGSFLENRKKQKQEEEITTKIKVEIIPKIKVELRGKIVEIFNQHINDLVLNISAEFERKLQIKKQEIEEAQRQRAQNIQNIEEEVAKYEALEEEIKNISEKILK